MQFGVVLSTGRLENCCDLWFLRRTDHGRSRVNHSRFFAGDRFDGVAEVFPVIEANGAEGDEETQDMDGEAAAGDLYGMLGYRARRTPAITTQQWLAFRLIEL